MDGTRVSSCLCPNAPHPHVERRYLVVPGLRSSRIYIIDTKADPRHPTIAKVIEPEEVIERTGYSRPHTVIADLRASTSPPSATPLATGLAASSSWTPRPSRCSAAGRLTGAHRLSPTTPGGISATTRW